MKQLIEETKTYVTRMLSSQLPDHYYYHNLHHTLKVVSAIKTLCADILINEWEKNTLLLAGWLHDVGYCYTYDGHESISMTLAMDFLKEHRCSDLLIRGVTDCIRTTRMPQTPRSLTHSIMCDADMAHLGDPNYIIESEWLRQEWKKYRKLEYSDHDWALMSLNFLKQHHYFTQTARELWDKGKDRNIISLKQFLKP